MIGGKLVEIESLIDGPAESLGGEVVEKETVTGVFVDVEVLNGVFESSGGVGNGEGTVTGTDHLRESTRLEGGGHEDKV